MSKIDILTQLKALNEARTKGPWHDSVKSFHAPGFIQSAAVGPLHEVDDKLCCDQAHADAAFIAALANNADWLIGCVEALQWYADEFNYGELRNPYQPNIDLDRGQEARSALEGMP